MSQTGEASAGVVEQVIEPRERDLGGFSVRRVLPHGKQRAVGPFVFFDQMGPADFPPGKGIDVRPHPHIGLATVTYLYDGELRHQDSLGNDQMIYPGEVNWMIAGRGITHSERTSPATREKGFRAYGIQTWVALPRDHEADEPSFEHHPSEALPLIEAPGRTLRVILGTAYGETSPVRVFSPMFYVDARLDPGQALEIPDDYAERAVYVVSGSILLGGETWSAGRMLILRAGERVSLYTGEQPTRLMLAGGAPLDGERILNWNFVASDQATIDRARAEWQAADWQNGLFSLPPGDDQEYIPLPS